ncbi:cell division protein ZapA [Oceanirhabdus sp. W0125-5]|uniref:cell division protein ZapA n=1 Tax=Oceanirhabdus sp. W0125-5 TaxID=2999116 RepID=UPI0022F2ED32|nr:cell division protein ZapA [Oceanirhabdus sp. W0125-5]WBW99412.1 cell division protein ZapA [Oceanirhabdus sp. W0125-5]
MNVVTVTINGIEYNLRGEESDSYILKVADIVNDTIMKIKSKNNMLNATDVIALASIRITDEFLKGIEERDMIQRKAREIYEKNASMSEELKEMRQAFKELQEENNTLLEKNEKLSSEQHILDYEKEIASLRSQLNIIEDKSKKYIKENSELKNVKNELLKQIEDEEIKHKVIRDKNLELSRKIIRMEQELMESNIALAKTLQRQNEK